MSFPGARLLGLRGRAEGLLKLGLMSGPSGAVAAAGASVPAFSSATASSEAAGFTTVGKLFDHDTTTRWQSSGEVPARLMLAFTAQTYLKYIDFSSYNNGNFTPGQITLDYSDTGITGPWTDSAYGTLTVAGYPYADSTFGAEGTVARFTTPGTLLKQYWRINIPAVVLTGYDSSSGVAAIAAQFYHTALTEPMVP